MTERCMNLVASGPFWYRCGEPEGHRTACWPRSEEERHALPGRVHGEETQQHG